MTKWLVSMTRVLSGAALVGGSVACGGDDNSSAGSDPAVAVQQPTWPSEPSVNPNQPPQVNDMQPVAQPQPAGVGADSPPVMTGDGDGAAVDPMTGDLPVDPMTGDGDMADPMEDPAGDPSSLEPFSFFVTSLEVMQELSGSPDGFGGNLGGLAGADSVCQQAAERVGFGAKTWRAFLSATDGGDGNPVHAIDRIGEGPWYDRNGRLIAENVQGLLATRPAGDPQTINDLPDEFGTPLTEYGDSHDVVTGTNAQGQLDSLDPTNTCNDWTSTTVTPNGGNGGDTNEDGGGQWGGFPGGGFPGGPGGPGGFGNGVRIGHAWPAQSGQNWMAAHAESSCAAGVNLVQNGPGDGSSIGAGGGWGAIYCFALQP